MNADANPIVQGSRAIGLINATSPRTNVELATIEPIKSPNAKLLIPCNIDFTSTITSGKEVPSAINVKPIT